MFITLNFRTLNPTGLRGLRSGENENLRCEKSAMRKGGNPSLKAWGVVTSGIGRSSDMRPLNHHKRFVVVRKKLCRGHSP